MLDDLTEDLHLHSFSFLSIKDIAQVRTTNKKYNNLITDSAFWQQLIKRDFLLEAKNSESAFDIDESESNKTYKNLHLRFIDETKKMFATFPAFLFILDWKKQELSRNQSTALIHYRYIIHKNILIVGYFQSNTEFQTEYQKLQDTYPHIDPKFWQKFAEDFINNSEINTQGRIDKDELLEALSDTLILTDSTLIFHTFFKLLEVNNPELTHQQLGGIFLNIACKLQSMNIIKYLLKQNININQICRNENFFELLCDTPLNQAINSAFRNTKNAREIVELLLKHGADPDITILAREGRSEIRKTIRELCRENYYALASSRDVQDILSLVSHAPEITNIEENKNKRKQYGFL